MVLLRDSSTALSRCQQGSQEHHGHWEGRGVTQRVPAAAPRAGRHPQNADGFGGINAEPDGGGDNEVTLGQAGAAGGLLLPSSITEHRTHMNHRPTAEGLVGVFFLNTS